MKKCVFFDRDGIVNKRLPARYVRTWDEFEFLPQFATVLSHVQKAGYAAIIVTNQRGVALGLVAIAEVDGIHARLMQLLSDEYGLCLTDILFCPHDEGECECRKPKPGMLFKAARIHNITLSESWIIGDSESDILAGRAAGCRTIYVGSDILSVKPDLTAPDMNALQSLIVKALPIN
ncbi:MAG: HAD family hydrolase [Lentisphaerae bacterium]|nr:HAD family hydrolase [Lentisphaerota bacterium]